MSKFTLMNKNKKVFDFEYNDEDHLIVGFERNYPDNEKYAPFGLIKNDSIDKPFIFFKSKTVATIWAIIVTCTVGY